MTSLLSSLSRTVHVSVIISIILFVGFFFHNEGFAFDSCSKVIENVDKNDDLGVAFKSAYTSYVMGFFSGVNVVYEDDTGLEGVEGLYLEVLANCKASPEASFISAIINLYAELKK